MNQFESLFTIIYIYQYNTRVFTPGKRHALSDTTPRILTLPYWLQNGELSSGLCYPQPLAKHGPAKHTATKSASSTEIKKD